MKFKTVLVLLNCLFYLNAQNIVFEIDKNWQFSKTETQQWYPAKFPNSIHTDLFENGLIVHPFIGDNEKDLQWIADKHWTYQTDFELDKNQLKNNNAELVFEGLDTYAKVFLNDELILETNNAFRIWKVDVRNFLKKKNQLRIEFTPTAEIEKIKIKEIPYELPESPRVFTRKPAFQYGWDWGPKYNTVGIWRSVYLNFWNDLKIEDIYIKQNSLTEEIAKLTAEIELKNSSNKNNKIEIYVNDKLFSETQINKGIERLKIPLTIHQPKFWWSNGLGEAYLYEFKIRILDSKRNLIEEKIIKKGLRTIELVTEKDELGESFYFKLNGRPVFMKGANYIPQNSFQNWVSKDNYDKLLSDVQKSNMNMLRVWGGGIYEDDYFYELCDEKGILVWQDFMFGNGMYPGDKDFLENVRQEAVDNVKRLRNHTSIALWCGNNEISEGWHRWGWQDGRGQMEKTEIWRNYQKIFNGILPEVVENLTDLDYWETSPKYGRGDARYISEGDAHDWWIWHDGHPFEDLLKKTPRFMSEFGFQSFPSEKAIRYMNKDGSFSINSEDFKNHEKHSRGFDIIQTYMERDFPVPDNPEDYAYMTQLVQAFGIGNAIEAQRRNMPDTMGSLYWQMNDCWPSVSWSGIDYFGNWKPLQYRVKEAFENVLLTYEESEDGVLKFYVVNDTDKKLERKFTTIIYNFEHYPLYVKDIQSIAYENKSNYIGQIDLKELELNKNEIFVKIYFGEFEKIFTVGRPKDLKLKNKPIFIEINENGIFARTKYFQKNIRFTLDNENHQSFYLEEMEPGFPYKLEFDKEDIFEDEIKIKSLNTLINK